MSVLGDKWMALRRVERRNSCDTTNRTPSIPIRIVQNFQVDMLSRRRKGSLKVIYLEPRSHWCYKAFWENGAGHTSTRQNATTIMVSTMPLLLQDETCL